MPRGKSESTAEVWRDRVVRWKQSGLTARQLYLLAAARLDGSSGATEARGQGSGIASPRSAA
jgi:hypothetical protein